MKRFEVRKHYDGGQCEVWATCATYEEAEYQYDVADRQNGEFAYTWLSIEEVER